MSARFQIIYGEGKFSVFLVGLIGGLVTGFGAKLRWVGFRNRLDCITIGCDKVFKLTRLIDS